MDAVAYQRAFDEEQLAILCANYDRRISSLDVENRKLRELMRDMWAEQEALPYGAHIEIRDRMRELGVEV